MSEWYELSNRAGPADAADFRGTQGLTQAGLEELIGNADTLLPDHPSESGAPYYVWSCWEAPPPGFDTHVQRYGEATASASFLCGREPRHKTGTPLAVEAPRPPGHPLDVN